jgi:nitrogen regulatory protein PII
MKLVSAIIQPHKLNDVKNGLSEAGIQGLTVSDVQGYGQQKGYKQVYHGHEYNVNLHHKIQLEIFVSDEWVDRVIEIIRERASTGNVGDGKIVVLPIERTVRIRTGETGDDAI